MGNGWLIEVAKGMRAAPTPGEERFWALVRRGRVGGLHFRRQVRIGDFIADFVCQKAMLVVEVIGSVHDDPMVRAKDMERYTYFRQKGYSVLEFSNDAVLKQPYQVMDEIFRALGPTSSTPSIALPPPQAGGGGAAPSGRGGGGGEASG